MTPTARVGASLRHYCTQLRAGRKVIDPTALLRLTQDEADAAGDAWSFNCGPGAICALLGLTPGELRPHLGDFERKGYTDPRLMLDTLRALHVPFVEIANERSGGDGG